MRRMPKDSGTERQNRWVVPGLVVAGAGLFLAGLVALEHYAKKDMRGGDRDLFAFAEIRCASPPGVEASAFLGEVQYLAGLPDQLHLLDEDLVTRLAEAFGRHPWVRKVERVEKSLSPRQVQVVLSFRIPVLLVPISAKEADRLGGLNRVEVNSPGEKREVTGRAVDGEGILLPAAAATSGLPVLVNEVPLPAGPAGMSWGNPAVAAAARTAAFLQSQQGRLGLARFHVESEELRLETSSGSRVLWGRAPGEETAEEATTEVKLQRLLEFIDQHGNLGAADRPQEHDVRGKARGMSKDLK